LLRDISEVFTREKMNVIGVQTQTVKGLAFMTFTIEVTDARQVARAMSVVSDVPAVTDVRRK
jgi:GTP pyrophosphokinase